MDRTKTYQAMIFKQRANAPLQVVFVAPSSEIDSWARIPTKKTGNVRHFQRAQIAMHVQEVQRFFENKNNSSPTAIVVGFDPTRARQRIRVLDPDGREIKSEEVAPGDPIHGSFEITWTPDADPQTADAKIAAITVAYPTIQQFVFNELADITGGQMTSETLGKLAGSFRDRALRGELPETTDTDASEEPGVDDESSDSDEDDTDEVPVDAQGDLAGLSPSPREVVVGRLTFLSRLQPDLLKDLPATALDDTYREVVDELKPGLLIDGQHRVLGTRAIGTVPFLVTALPTADWPELAFQFIVTNRTARRVAESLLISIVGQSLSKDQRGTIEERLREANIRVGLIEAVMRVHEDEQSPFFQMLAFGLKHEDGFIDAAAFRGKVIQLWYERKSPVKELLNHLCQGKSPNDRTDILEGRRVMVRCLHSLLERCEGPVQGNTRIFD